MFFLNRVFSGGVRLSPAIYICMDRAALRPAPAAGIRFPEFHPQVFKANDVALFIAEDLRWGSQKDEFDAFMFGRDDFHFIGRHLFAGAAVDDRYFSNNQADQGAHAVDGGVAAEGIGEKMQCIATIIR